VWTLRFAAKVGFKAGKYGLQINMGNNIREIEGLILFLQNLLV